MKHNLLAALITFGVAWLGCLIVFVAGTGQAFWYVLQSGRLPSLIFLAGGVGLVVAPFGAILPSLFRR